MPRNLEVGGSNDGLFSSSFTFFYLSLSTLVYQWSVLNQVPQGGAILTVCSEISKNGCLAELAGSKQAQ